MPGCRKILTILISAAFAWPLMAQSERGVVQLRYLGTAGWEITDGRTVVLVDPYLSRLRRVTPNDTVDPADARPLFDNAAIARIRHGDHRRANHARRLCTIAHTHYDHALDAPYIASKTGATIIGTESTYHFARTQGVSADKLIVVRGGEDYAFEGLSVRVIRQPPRRSSAGAEPPADPSASLPPAVFPRDAKPPFRMGDLLIEGGTLVYLIRLGGREILAFGSMNYIEREIEGLRPDVALIGAMPERREEYISVTPPGSCGPWAIHAWCSRHIGIASTSLTTSHRTPPFNGCRRLSRKLKAHPLPPRSSCRRTFRTCRDSIAERGRRLR